MLFAPALRHRQFRVLFMGLVFSSFGNNFSQLAMSWQMYAMTGSPLQLGLLGLSRAAATMPVLLFGGLLADAVDRRRLLMMTQGGQMLLSAALLVLSAAGLLAPGVFYVTAVLGGLLQALDGPARNAIVPNLVPEADLANAMALNATQRSVAQIAGPPLAGILLGFVGPTANYGVTTASWVVMLGALFIVRPPLQVVGGRRAVSLQALREGLSYVWTHPILLWMMALDFGQNFLGAARALLPIYASEILLWPGTQEKIGAQGYGLLSGASAFGSIAGGMLLSGLPHARKAGLGVLTGVAIYGSCTTLFAYNEAFWLAWLLLAGEGFGDTVSQIFRTTILQLNIPDHLRGRVTSINAIFINGGPSLGSFRAGVMGQWLGPQMAVLSGGLAVLVVVAALASAVPMVRRYVIEPTGSAAR